MVRPFTLDPRRLAPLGVKKRSAAIMSRDFGDAVSGAL